MRTSRFDESDAAAAVAGIHHRRTVCADPDLEQHWPGLEDRLAVLRYITAYQRVPDWVLLEDLRAELTIIGYLRTELDRRQMVAMRVAHGRLGASWRTVAGWLGLRSAQAAEQCYLRLQSAHRAGGGPRSHEAARRDRDDLTGRPKVEPIPTALLRLLLTVVADLHQARPQLPDDVAERVVGLGEEATPEATLAMVRWIVADLATTTGPVAAALVAKAEPLMSARASALEREGTRTN